MMIGSIVVILVSPLVVVLVIVVAARFVRRVLRGAAGFVAHTVSSEVFGSGLPMARVVAESVHCNPVLRALSPLTRIRVDHSTRHVSVGIAGIAAAQAQHRPSLGTLVVHGPVATEDAPTLPVRTMPDPFPQLTGPVVPVLHATLGDVLDQALGGARAPRNTRAVLVVHRGRIVAERYATGIGPDTPLLTYSVAKSVTNALIGILVRQGRLRLDQPAPVPEWQRPGDPRSQITVEHLMRMTSGLSTTETNSGLDDVTRILYSTHDMAAAARAARLDHEPGTRYEYSSVNTLILASIVRDLVGGNASAVREFAQRELFDPLRMGHTSWEFDACGTPIGSTYLLASARDLARLGLLFLHDGELPSGRVLPAGWVAESTRQTLDSEYGAGWRPVASAAAVERFGLHDVPTDAFFAVGYLGQYIVVVPSEELVIVRLGATYGRIGQVERIGDLVRAAIAACAQNTPTIYDRRGHA